MHHNPRFCGLAAIKWSHCLRLIVYDECERESRSGQSGKTIYGCNLAGTEMIIHPLSPFTRERQH